ncbi:unnamed protein product [Kuraishia capsulata CBS 1993]|uniref:Dolichyl-phosphate-mannose--protein mannosyltransferase n=1 Tax=Kuraishia capsulata CBS 1993 TaxID=1382522 RepID=W6MWR7_9ASCO|nr:uncharacterized protein KUCA_T00003769001 [Kuraishia capsulata CBS 1993]CDK27790.1 unnamed protein product [Kuraishia capsulata CBS 1993]
MSKRIPKKALAKAAASSRAGESDFTTELIYEKGELRPFVVTTPSAKLIESREVHKFEEKVYLALLIVFASLVRLHSISNPDSVVFDEVHFGGFARKYINGDFFMDVHPPLAKMLFAGVASLGGFKGDFAFEKIGDKFPSNVPYVLMREFPAVLGIATCVLVYLTLRSTGCKPIVSLITAALFVIENANVTISRFILLDSPLLFFIAASVYSLKRVENATPFSFSWYRALFASGMSMGLALSSKWVGLFTIIWAGAVSAWNLWFTIGDLRISTKKIYGQIIVKVSVLLGIPFFLYLFFFSIHFQLLVNEGDGAAFMSSAFRSSFRDATIPQNTQANVGVGSVVTIRHLNTVGGYLHSHNHLYEGGSGQQQITLYPHLDDNNKWEIELYNVSEAPTQFEPITDGTKIRLKHILTQRRLHSHDVRPVVSEQDWQNEVSAYGYEGFEGDANDDFIVEIVKQKSKSGDAQNRVRAIETVFRLHHAMTGCYLWSHETKLPKWGFEQQEVTCPTQGIKSLGYWYIEQNVSPFLDASAERVSYPKLTFFQKLLELHQRMWQVNKGLTASHVYESRPASWPFLTRGISYWRNEGSQVYFLGNPVTWWASSVFLFGFSVYVVFSLLKWQRGYSVGSNSVVFNYNVQMSHIVLGWAIHYFPSFLMERQLFLHHYLPALYFSILGVGQTFEVLYSYVLRPKRYVSVYLFVILFTGALYYFVSLSPLIYGTPWIKSKCETSKLLVGWDYDCNGLPEEIKGSETIDIFSAEATTAIAPPIEVEVVESAAPVVEEILVEQSEHVAAEPAVEVGETPLVDDEASKKLTEEGSTMAEPEIEDLETK